MAVSAGNPFPYFLMVMFQMQRDMLTKSIVNRSLHFSTIIQWLQSSNILLLIWLFSWKKCYVMSVFLLCLAQEKPRRLPYRETPSGCLRLYSTMCNHDKNKARQHPATHMVIQTCKLLIVLYTCTYMHNHTGNLGRSIGGKTSVYVHTPAVQLS